MFTYDSIFSGRFLGDWVVDSSLEQEALRALLLAMVKSPHDFSFNLDDVKHALEIRGIAPILVGMVLYDLMYSGEI